MIRCCILPHLSNVILTSYYQVLHLLAACQKYEMESTMSLIRTRVESGEFPAPKGAEAFAAYAIASGKRLIPEMEKAALLTLDHPMTFETLGEEVRSFEGWALRNLASFRMRCRNNIDDCLDGFLESQILKIIWRNCTQHSQSSPRTTAKFIIPKWLIRLISQCKNDLKKTAFTDALDTHSRIGEMYRTALETHAASCNPCKSVHLTFGSKHFAGLENDLAQARKKVTYYPLLFKYHDDHH